MTDRRLTTHVLDTVKGQGAAGMKVDIHRHGTKLASITLDAHGRGVLLDEATKGAYEINFHAGDYQGAEIYNIIPVHVNITNPDEHYHIPLILSPFGYSTYRGT
jgi:5-hydroxyisourate hydrolase